MHEDIPSNCGRSGINCGRHRRLAMLGIFSAAVLTVAGCQFPAPSPGDGASFSKVAAAEPNQAWAVGHYDQNGQSHALLEYWNGKAWQLISVDSRATWYADVAAASTSDVWVVGPDSSAHWNGQIWRAVSNPKDTQLTAVSIGRDGAARALGYSHNASQVYSWTKNGWSRMHSQPFQGATRTPKRSSRTIADVSVLTANDLWVVSGTDLAHWNGQGWKTFHAPLPSNAYLAAISAHSHGEVWAVGTEATVFEPTNRYAYDPIALHFTNGRLVRVPTPGSIADGDLLTDVDASGAQVWAVGHADEFNGLNTLQVIRKWDGNEFAPQPTQDIYSDDSHFAIDQYLSGVAVSGGKTWSVGAYQPQLGPLKVFVDLRPEG